MFQRVGHEHARFSGLPLRHHDCLTADMLQAKRFVYVLWNAQSEPDFYVGLTSDVSARLWAHNAGRCSHTASRRPWQVHVVIEFTDERRAVRFERYLKSGSGRAFAKRHFEG
jgi:putative endonuclease